MLAIVLKNLIPLIIGLKNGEFVSGQKLASELNVSRTTISSWVAELVSFGLDVNKVTGKGYRLCTPIELLDRRSLLSLLSVEVQSKLKVLDILADSESTNKIALSSQYEVNEWKLFASEFQHAGRGRRGREWLSPFGANLLFSLGHKTIWKAEILYLASMISGLAVAEVLRQEIGDKVKLKWPNDVYIGDQKVAGILCELLGSPQDEALLVIGIGINVNDNPNGTDIPSTKLSDHVCAPVNRTELLAKLTNRIITDLSQANQNGVGQFFNKWAAIDYLRDKQVKVIQGSNIFKGLARGIDKSGQLIIELEDATLRSFNGGEVSVRW